MNPRPNILLFVTDDHGPWSIGCSGNSEALTPNLDRLAAGGTRFANAFTPSPVCSAARACLFTGRTPSQVGIHDWIEELYIPMAIRDWLAGEVLLSTLLHDAGYWSALSGKWHMGRSHQTPPGFDRCFGLPGTQGLHNEEYLYHLDGEPITLSGNKSAHITDHAISFLNEAPSDQPFFINVGYIATHSPYAARFHDPERVALFKDATFRDIPKYRAHERLNNEGLPDVHTAADLRERYTGYYAAVAEIDANIGLLLAALESTGRARDTIVIYVSDHGCSQGHHGYFGKGNSTRPINMYDTSLRIPVIMQGPAVPAAAVNTQLVTHYDLFQTLLEFANVSPPTGRSYPGVSLAADLAHAPAHRDFICGEYGDLRMIRTRTHKFVKRYPAGPHDLFDLQNDPMESRNLADEAAHQAIRNELDRLLESWYAAYEDPDKSGLRVKLLPRHNHFEAWRDGKREAWGLQVYPPNTAAR